MPPRLLAVDLDGTLLRSDHTPHPDSAAALLRAQETGMLVVIASGRVGPVVRRYADSIGLKAPIVSNNGADTFGPDDEDWGCSRFKPGVIPAALKALERSGETVTIYTRTQALRHGAPDPEVEKEAAKLGLSGVGVPPEEEVAKLLVVVPEGASTEIAALLSTTVGDEGLLVASDPRYLELLPPNVDKATGLERIITRLGIEWSETAAIGDYLNDVAMLRKVGRSAAMANAHPEARAAAGVTVGTNEAGGVGEFVDLLLAGA